MLTAERLRELLDYNPETGEFEWRFITVGHSIDDRVGFVSRSKAGYPHLRVKLADRSYLLHRLAWLWMTGEWPKEIDHINRNPLDNRWENLRDVTHLENIHNSGRWEC